MELQQLRYVVAVADTASFTRAAVRCHVTQSALSHQIAALERAIGQRLFVRSSRMVRPTEAGEAFIPHARAALIAAEKAVEDVASVTGRVIGVLRLGVIPTATAVDVAALLVKFRADYPEARLELRTGSSSDLMDSVRAGDLDVALLGLHEDIVPAGLAYRELVREPLAVALGAEHPLARRARISLAELSSETFADFPEGSSGRAQSDAGFVAAELKRDVAFEADTSELLLKLVSAGLAVSLLAPRVIESTSLDVVAVPVSDGPVRVEYVAWHAQAPRTVARAFLAVLDAAR